MVRFAHLHCHSHFSLLEANTRIEQLCDAAAQAGQQRLALTDHGNLFGAIQFYKAAKAKGLVPIIGCEVNVVRDRTAKDPKESVQHLTLLAENLDGYQNLIKLVSAGYQTGFYFRPRIDRELLRTHARGILALTGCMAGEVSRRVLAGDLDGSERAVGELRELFGRDNVYIEVMENGLPLQRRQREGLAEVAQRTGAIQVLTNNVHYLKPEHAAAREVMMCIASGKTLQDENRWHLDTDQHCFRTSEEMAGLFRGAEAMAENAFAVAERCNLELRFDQFHLPHFEIPNGEDPLAFFRRLCEEGVARRYGAIDEKIRRRLDYEIDVIREMGFIAYFLIVADFISFARRAGVPVGPGRGSAAGSIVAYGLGITDVDPLRYDLLFERFLNRGRISMPDIDIDFCRDGREQVIRYVQDKYGRDNVCQIATFGTMAAKAAVRDAGRALGLDLAKVDTVAKRIPTTVGTKLGEAIEQDEDLRKLRDSDPEVKRLFDISLSIEGLNRHTSTHAAGVVITDRALTEYVPLCRVQDEFVTQYSMTELEAIGLLKMDFLGLKTLTVLARAEALIRASGVELVLEQLPLEDRKTYELLQKGDTTGVFQLESSGMRELLQKMRPDVFEDIVAILALYRPGPLGSGMVDSFVNRKHGKEEITYPHPLLEPILEETYGVMVYQEQIMRISNALAGFSLEEADNLRKAMGKKKPEVMEKFRAKFVDGAAKKQVDPKLATEIWETMAFFAGYGFNKSHTVAYGILTYRTAYLRANYPVEFLAACMSIDRGDTDKVSQYLDECRRAEIAVLCPSVNESDLDFTIKDRAIRFGLGAIKGVGEKAVEAVLAARKKLRRPFRTVVDVFEHVDVAAANKTVHEAFIAAGAYDWTDQPRARIAASLDALLKIGHSAQVDRRAGQLGLFARPDSGTASDYALPPIPEWPDREKLLREKEALGLFLSDNPLRRHATTLARFASHRASDLPSLENRAEVSIGGSVVGLRLTTTKKGKAAGQKMAMFRIASMDGVEPLQAVCFAEDYKACADVLSDDAVCLFTGLVDKSREEPGLRVTKVEPVERILTRRVMQVIVTLAEPSENVLQRLRDTMQAHPGDVPVYLSFPRAAGGEDLVRCGARFKVKLDESSLDALSAVVGKTNVICR